VFHRGEDEEEEEDKKEQGKAADRHSDA